MCAQKYHFKDGRRLFVSHQTLNEGANKLLLIADGQLLGLEAVVAFKKFDGPKTGVGIGTWMMNEHASKGLLPAYVGYHSTDGASNAVSSVKHYALLTATNNECPVYHDKCMAHQANRSAKYASGTGDFKTTANPFLRRVLMKAHTIIAIVHRSTNRLKVVRDVQKAAKRTAIVIPTPSVVTRWDSSNREVSSLNRIMGDFNAALTLLWDGPEKNPTNNNGDELDRDHCIFTAEDKMILRQFECGSEPCLLLSKFFQLNESTCHETLFVTAARIAQLQEPTFSMYGDISHTELPDLTKRTKTVTVYTADHVLSGDGRTEQPMDECIELFRSLYANDMAFRCGLAEDDMGTPVAKYPTIIAMAALLNPMNGGKLYFPPPFL
jgi:hypothetical protein